MAAPWYKKMWDELDGREDGREVAAVGTLKRFFDEPLHRQRGFFAEYMRESNIAEAPKEQSPCARQRARRRQIEGLPPDLRGWVREKIADSAGRTHQIDRRSDLCWRLHLEAELTAAEIWDLLAALQLERGNVGESGRARVQRRIDRARARQRPVTCTLLDGDRR